jgi:hypothetical protein
MAARPKPTEKQDRRLSEWQMLLLRFAITRDPNDRSALIASATELDSAATAESSSFTFFVRTSHQLCNAIERVPDATAATLLDQHARRIVAPRLRAAFLACLDLKQTAAPRPRPRAAWRTRPDLWKGMPKR